MFSKIKQFISKVSAPPTQADHDAANVEVFFKSNYLFDIENSFWKEAEKAGLERPMGNVFSEILQLGLAFPVADFALRWGVVGDDTSRLVARALKATKWKPIPNPPPGGSTVIIPLVKAIVKSRQHMSRADLVQALSNTDLSHLDETTGLNEIRDIFYGQIMHLAQSLRLISKNKTDDDSFKLKVWGLTCSLSSWFAKDFDRERFLSPIPSGGV
ncbi:MAG: hypothetical protein ABL974_10965 [Prosthecobacter sp.]